MRSATLTLEQGGAIWLETSPLWKDGAKGGIDLRVALERVTSTPDEPSCLDCVSSPGASGYKHCVFHRALVILKQGAPESRSDPFVFRATVTGVLFEDW